MTFDEYQELAITTDKLLTDNKDISSRAFIDKLLGLSGESGEIAEKFKKIYRDKPGSKLSKYDEAEIVKELGDLLWYLSATAYYLNVPLSEVAKLNLDKVIGRKKRNVIGGHGDNR
jgi:NTP pyrophosphatase (non-canonical NTP hydrolase)